MALVVGLIAAASGLRLVGATIEFNATPYLDGQFFLSDPVAVEDEPISLHVAPLVDESEEIAALRLELTITDRRDQVMHEARLDLSADEGFRGKVEWTPETNGLYTAHAVLRKVEAGDASEALGQAKLTLPVRVDGREVHFAWYKSGSEGSDWSLLRWATLFTRVPADRVAALKQRGITALKWAFGPMRLKLPDDRSKWPELLEKRISRYADFQEQNEQGYDGLGLDEFGGFRATEQYDKTDAFLHEMARQREALHEGSVIASWAGGGLPLKWASLHRETADFVLLELYVLGYFPPTTGTENIYGLIDNRVDAMRARDMFLPSWGSQARTLIALDSNMRHGLGHYHPGEIENVIRYLRRVVPEMRGLALYNGNEGKGDAYESIRERNIRLFDQLFFDYFIRPVVTVQPESLWVEEDELVLAISNIGSMDSGPVTVEFRHNGETRRTSTVETVPAGFSRHDNRVLVRASWDPEPGLHEIEARIVDSEFGTVLDARVERDIFIQNTVRDD